MYIAKESTDDNTSSNIVAAIKSTFFNFTYKANAVLFPFWNVQFARNKLIEIQDTDEFM